MGEERLEIIREGGSVSGGGVKKQNKKADDDRPERFGVVFHDLSVAGEVKSQEGVMHRGCRGVISPLF